MVYHGDFRGSHPDCGPGRVDGGVAASYDGHPVVVAYHHLVASDAARLIEADTPQKPDGLAYSRMVYALDVEFFRTACACAHEYGVEAAREKFVDCEVAPYGGVEVENHAQVFDFLNLASHHVLGQAVFGYAEHQHASGL